MSMAFPEIKDPDKVEAAIAKAREHAEKLGKPLQHDRVAVFLGVNHEAISAMMDYKGEDEAKQAVANALKMAKQESRADLMDCMSDKGNVVGYIFQGKANHGMIERTAHEVDVAPIRFVGEENLPE